MLDLMRRQSSLIYVIFGGIIFVFALNFGPAPSSCASAPSTSWAAKVNGESIRQHDFAILYNRQMAYLQQLSERSGQPFDPSMAAKYGLPKQVLDTLVERRLLAQQARDHNLVVTDAELVRFLRAQYEVKQDIAYETYENWVQRAFETNVARFEEDTRQDIAATHFAQIVRDGVTVGDAELQAEYLRDHDRAQILFARFDADVSHAPTPPSAALDKLLADEFPAVEAYYQKNAQDYRIPAQIHLRQIVKKLAPDAAASDVQAATDALQALRAQAKAGTDFGGLAQSAAADAQVPIGGDMGFLTYEELAPPLAAAARGLAPGDISEPVRSPMGLHLLQVVEARDAHKRELADIKPEVAAALFKEREAQTAAAAQAQVLHQKLHAGGTWEKLTQKEDDAGAGPKPARQSTAFFKHADLTIPRVGQSTALREAIFAQPGAKDDPAVQRLLPKVYEVGGSYFVVAVQAREVPNMDHFKDEQKELRDEALRVKRSRVLHDFLAYLRSQSKIQTNPAVFGQGQAQG